MSDGTLSSADRVRAGLASMLGRMAAGARRLEQWSVRGTRPIFVSVVAVALLAFGALAIVSGGHFFGGWWHHGPSRAWVQAGPPPKPPSASAKGRPSNPSSAYCDQTASE